MATIKDVAKRAGVSPATVSNVINKTASVSEEKTARVLAAMEELKFSPNLYAKNLRFKTNKYFAVVVSSVDSTTQRVLEGITDSCREHGYVCNLYVTRHNRVQECNDLKEIQTTGVAGIFLQTCDNEVSEAVASVLAKEIPLVFFDNYLKNPADPSVIFNNTTVVEEALLEYLRPLGAPPAKEDVLFVSAGTRYSNDVDAMIGVERALNRGFISYSVPAEEAEAFYHLVKYFEGLEHYPSLIVSTRESITGAVFRLIEYFGLETDVIYLTDDAGHPAPRRIPLRRRAYELGVTAAEMMFRALRSPLGPDRALTIVDSKTWLRERTRPVLPSVLHLTLYDGPTASALLPAIKAFERRSGVEIEYELYKYDELFERIEEIGRTKSPETDIVMIDLPWFDSFHRAEYLYPLNAFINEDNDEWLGNFSDEIKKIYFYTNSLIYSIPILTNMQYMFYRRDLFENAELKRAFYNKYGIELNAPRTWREFEIIARFFTREYNPSSPVKYGTTLQGMDPVSIAEEFFPRQWAYGGKLLSSRKIPVLNSRENAAAFLNLKNIYECTPKQSVSSSWEANFTKMTESEIAMYFNFSTHIGSDNGFPFTIDFSNIAVTKAPGNYSMLGGYNLGVSAYSARKETAFRFIKYLTCGEMAINNTLMGCCIPHNAVLKNDRCINAFPWLRNMQAYILSAKRRENLYDAAGRLIPPKEVNALLFETAAEIFGDRDIPSALNDANLRLGDLLRK